MAASAESRPAEPALELPPLRGVTLALLTVAIAVSTFMEVLDMTIVNVSIPSIAGSLAVSPNEATWTISSYAMAAAIAQPLTGWLGRRFGEVHTFIVSMVLFVVFSAFCGLATNMPMLVAARLLQGFVSGPMVPMAQALLVRNFPRQRMGLAMAVWGMVVMIAPICGPILGGWINDHLSWPWLFYINVPVGLLAAVLAGSILRGRDNKAVHIPIDIMGLVLLVIGVGSLQFMLDNGNDLDWFGSPLIILAAISATVGLSCLIIWELTDRHPTIDLHLFENRNYRIGVLMTCVAYFCFMASTILFPLWLQTTMGYTASWAGLAMAPVGFMALFMMPLVGSNLHRMNLRVNATFGFIVIGTGMFWMGNVNTSTDYWHLVPPRLLMGIGMPFFFLSLNNIFLADIKPDQIASAVGLSNFLRTMSSSTATAVTVWLWTRRSEYHQAVLTEQLRAGQNWSAYQSHLHALGLQGQALLAQARGQIVQQAQTLGSADVFHACGIVVLLMMPLIWLARPPFRSQGGSGAH